jgi:outer membrane protein assembly factor BamB
MRHLQRWTMVAAVVLFAACSKDKDIDKPAVLTPINATLKVDHLWSAKVADKGGKVLRLGLGLAVEGDRVFAAGYKGEVTAYNINNGHEIWRTKVKKEPFSGGPAAGHDLVVVGTSGGDVIALGSADGKIRWRVSLNGEILAAPAVSERVVAVRTVDGKLRALSPADGHELWTQEQQVPRLSLRGTSSPVIAGELTLCGFDNGKVVAVNMNDGSLQWEATIAPPHGKTELERLDDVDSTPHVSGQDVFTVGFQGKIAMLALDTGQVWWQHDASSYRDIALDDDAIYMATADGEVVALRRRTGAEVWRQKALLHRGLSAVALTDNAVVTADYKGNLHWLDKATGELAAREPTGKVRVSNAPVVSGNIVLVINDAGRISAYRTSPIGRAMAAPHGVPAETSSTGKAVATPETAPAATAPAPAPEPAPAAAPAPEPAAPPTITPQPQ